MPTKLEPFITRWRAAARPIDRARGGWRPGYLRNLMRGGNGEIDRKRRLLILRDVLPSEMAKA